MAIAETARLVASLELKDGLSKGVASATRGLGRMETGVGRITSKLGGLAGKMRGGFSNAIGTFGGRIKGLATAGLGLLGVGGLFTLGAAFKSAVGEAREFGDAVFRIQRITGQTAEATSRLVDALGDYGVDSNTAQRLTGLFEKNIARLGGTQAKANKFTKQYGLNLRDGKGQLLDFNDALLESADFFNNKAIPASQKAAALAAVYGRNWQTLIPLLSQGRKGLEETLNSSLTLSKEDLAAIEANRVATIKWDDAIGDLKVKIGIGLLPTITELVTTLTGWVSTHGPEIQQFMRDATSTIRGVAGTVVSVVGGIKSVWDSIPGPVRDLLIKGIVADRTIKFLFGFSITDLAKDLVGGAVKGLGGALVQAGIGKAFVQPVFVVNQVAGAGGLPGAAAGGGLGLVGSAIAGAGIGGAVVLGAQSAGVIADGWIKGYDASQRSDFQGMLDAQRSLATEMEVIPGPIRDFLKGIFDNGQAQLDEILKPQPVNKSGSPDDRQEAHDLRAAVNDSKSAIIASERNDRSLIVSAIKSPLNVPMSPDERQAVNDQKQKLDAVKAATDRARDATEAGKIATVSAINRIPSPKTTVNVSVNTKVTTDSISQQAHVTRTYTPGNMGGQKEFG